MKAKRKVAKPVKRAKISHAWPEPTAEEKAERKNRDAEQAREYAGTLGVLLDELRPKIKALMAEASAATNGDQRIRYAALSLPAVLPFFVTNIDGKFNCDLSRVAAVALILADKLAEIGGKTDADLEAILRPPQPVATPAAESTSPA